MSKWQKKADSFVLLKCNSKDDWLNKRGLGGSSASAILGVNPYMSANDLYDAFKFPSERKSFSNEATERGNYLEPLIRQTFGYLNKGVFKIIAPPRNNWIFYRKDKEWMTASLDGILIRKRDNERGVLEFKTREVRSRAEFEEWKNGTIPNNYYIQTLHYLNVTKFTYAYIVSYLILKDYESGEVLDMYMNTQTIYAEDRTKDLEILEKEETYFYENTQKGIRPRAFIEVPILKGEIEQYVQN